AHSFSLGSFSDPGTSDAPWHVVVDWGDSHSSNFDTSSQGSLGSKSHTYDDNGAYTVKVTVTDKDGGSGSAQFTANVANVAPTATFSNDGPVNEGSDFHLFLSSPSDPSSADTSAGFQYAFDCGSGYGAYSGTASATCSTTDNGVRSVKGKIKDKDGGVSEYTASVAVNNVNPVVLAPSDQSSNEGENHSFSLGSFGDPGADSPWSVDVGWGDGSPHTTFSKTATGSLGSQSHTYADNGSYTVTVKVTDKDGGSGQATFKANVANLAPNVTAPADQNANEGAAQSFNLGSFSDAGANDGPWAVDVDWGDGSAYTTFNQSSQGSLGSQSHTYENGAATAYTVTVKVTDKDGGSGQATFKVTVSNVPPTITSFTGTTTGLSGPLVFTAPVVFNGTFKDPGVIDNPWSADWSWDGTADPTSHQTYPANGTDTHTFTQSHQYTSAGCNHTGTVKITDKDGGSDTKTITVGVGSGAFLPPVTNTPVTNKLKNGQVLPVKIQITDCN